MHKFSSFSLLLVLVLEAESLSLPNYITACKIGENFNKCALENALKSYPTILKGDKKYGVPVLTPLHLPQVDISSPNLNLIFKNLKVTGLEDFDLQSIDYDFEKKKFSCVFGLKNLHFESTYEVSGRILILPITGSGADDVQLIGGKYVYELHWDEVDKADGKYMKVKKTSLDYKLKKATFRLDNLFNGDPRLGPEMNKFLNDNWEEVLKDIGTPITDAIEKVITEIIKNYFEKIPIDQIFLK